MYESSEIHFPNIGWLKPAVQNTSHNAETKASKICTCIWKHIIIIPNYFVNSISWASAIKCTRSFCGHKDSALKKKSICDLVTERGKKRLVSDYFKACFMEGKKHDQIHFRQDRLQDIQTKQLKIYVYGT